MWLCIYVDPRFKKAPMLTAARKSSIQSSLKYDLVTCILKEQRQSDSIQICEDFGTKQNRSKRTKLEKFFDSSLQASHSGEGSGYSANETAETELHRSELEDPLSLESKKPLLWWKEREVNYQHLSLLAKKFLCITATSVPSERLFSSAGNLLSEGK